MKSKIFYGWRVVAACFIVACFSWGLGLFGSSVYLQAVTAAHGWSISQVPSAITVFLLVSAAGQSALGRSIARHGPRPALLVGSDGVQLDLFAPYMIIEKGSRRVIVRTMEDGRGIKPRVNRLCEHFGGRYIAQEEGYVMTKAGVANMEAAYAKGRESFFWMLSDR